ncbi:MAG TPA: acetolactate synthase large subunit, partial [Kiloniellaceae bacterium]|nr:acetolactate synthase large subunit [Kiloniellaceae bacterium]
ADGYGRMTGKPALTLLHLGPGFANGIANLHNARRARTPIVNMIGEHATWHGAADAPLASDIDALARPVSAWVRRSESGETMAADMAEAIAQARGGAGQVATLILPHDLQLAPSGGAAPLSPPAARRAVSENRVRQAAEVLRKGDAVLFLGDEALSERGLKAAWRIASLCRARVMSPTSNARSERGAGLPPFERLPYLPEQALESLSPFRSMVLAGAKAPVGFFGWPGMPSSMVPAGCAVELLAEPDDDIIAALEALADFMAAPAYESPALDRPLLPAEGTLTAESLTQGIAALQPEGCILVNEAITSGWRYHQQSQGAPRFTELQLTGGAIGLGPSLSLGAAVACPDRQVIDLQADGSGLYNSQALWSQARQNSNVVTVICSNRRYAILQLELQRAGVNRLGTEAQALTDFSAPAVDWVSLAQGFGVPAARVEDTTGFAAALRRGLAEPGPYLIEACIA